MAIQVLSAKVTIGHAADMALKKDVLDWVSWLKDYLVRKMSCKKMT